MENSLGNRQGQAQKNLNTMCFIRESKKTVKYWGSLVSQILFEE